MGTKDHATHKTYAGISRALTNIETLHGYYRMFVEDIPLLSYRNVTQNMLVLFGQRIIIPESWSVVPSDKSSMLRTEVTNTLGA